MKLKKAAARDKKRAKHNKMKVTGRRVFLWQWLQQERAKKARKDKR